MKVIYLLEGAGIFGGVKVVLEHARLLRQAGIDAEAVFLGPPPEWFGPNTGFYRQVPALSAEAVGPADLVVGTMWRTVPIAQSFPEAAIGHLCQCYEGLYEPIRPQWQEIEAVYSLPTLKMAVSPHLVDLVEQRFGQRCHFVPQPFDSDLFSPPTANQPRDVFRVLIAGQWDLDIKGVEWAMNALAPLRDESPRIELVRLALDAPGAEVAAWPNAERHIAVPPQVVAQVMASVDLYVSASTPVEGFGLPALEALGCGRPTLLSDIPAYRSLDPNGASGLRFALGDTLGFVKAVRRLRDDPRLRQRFGRAGRLLAEQYSRPRTLKALLRALETLDPHLSSAGRPLAT